MCQRGEGVEGCAGVRGVCMRWFCSRNADRCFGHFWQFPTIVVNSQRQPFSRRTPIKSAISLSRWGEGRCLEEKKKEDGAGCGWFLVDPLLYVRTNTTNVHSSIWRVDTFIAQTSRELVG